MTDSSLNNRPSDKGAPNSTLVGSKVESASPRKIQETFFKLNFGQVKGQLCLAFLSTSDKREMMELWYSYPKDLDAALDDIERYASDRHGYFCPQLFSRKERKKEYVVATPNIWSDLDSCHPDKLLVEPSLVVESSPKRYQAYWLLEGEVDPKDAEDISRRIHYYHANDGADKSGWDLTQLLRIPGTFNFKYINTAHQSYPVVKFVKASKSYYRMSDFTEYPELVDYVYLDIPFDPDAIPEETGQDLLERYRADISPIIVKLFLEEPRPNKWSDILWQLEMLLFEANFSREQVFRIAWDAACNKYRRDGRPPNQLWREVIRAEELHNQKNKLTLDDTNLNRLVPLLTDAERKIVDALPKSFVDRYIDWASGLTDAAKQYHQVGGFVLLSSLLCGSVGLPTSHGLLVPNLWFMILAETTLTRKTTAMDIPMDLLAEVDESAIMATDGSLEGLFTNLSMRPKKPSVFLRDEFSGLIDAMTKKDYMAGMPEMLTKLYDGKFQRRLLRKEVIEIRDPRLIILGGGIKNKVTGSLTFEHVGSGFLPRFIFVTAEGDVNKLKPMGPPTKVTTGVRDALLDELHDLFTHYNGVSQVTIGGSDTVLEHKKSYNAELTEEAWARYNDLEFTLVKMGTQSSMPEVYTPVGDRLSKSILKAAVLLAASRQREDSEIVQVELQDILSAIKFGEQWRVYSEEVLDNIGKSQNEYRLDRILNSIKSRNNEGTSRSRIMRTYKLTSREATMVFDTLIGRDLIYSVPQGRTVLYYTHD